MGEGFRDLDVSRVVYLLLYLFLVILGLRGLSSGTRPGAEPRNGLRGWMDQHPWAVHGAVWGLIVWGLLAGRHLWLGEPTPSLVTLPLTVAGGLGVGWLLTLMHRRRG